jgi:succinyl-diaminopimelate desuccinylase
MSPADYLDQHESDLLSLLRDLVRLDTTNPPGRNYGVIAQRLADELRLAGLTAKVHPVPAREARRHLPEAKDYPRCNVIGRRRGRGAKRTIHFNAHFDVVPVSGQWRHGDPFSGQEEGPWIYGRGTADMKGSIAALLLALRALRATGVEPLMHVEVSFTADEETDSMLGAGVVVRRRDVRPDYVVVMEGGEKESICCGHNGVVWLKVTVHGRAAHGATPTHGINALEKMSALVLALEEHRRELATRAFTSPNGVRLHPTLNLGGVFGAGPGGKINTVPAEAHFTIDRRVLPNESVADAERELRLALRRAAAAIPQCRITVTKISDNHPCYSPPDHPFFAAMADCVSTVRRQPAVFITSSGFNDMYFFSHFHKVPTLGYGPCGQQCHAIDERARIKELVNSAKIYARLLTSFAG